MASDLYPAARDLLARLVSFDTTSRGSNLELIGWVEGYLDDLGVPHRRVPNADGSKSNLLATLGPADPGGVVLSGHTDVVPIDGQPWSTDPWTLTEKDVWQVVNFIRSIGPAPAQTAKTPAKK